MKKVIGRLLSAKVTVKSILLAILVIGLLSAATVYVAMRIPRDLPAALPKIARAFYVTELAYLRSGNGQSIDTDYSGGNVLTADNTNPDDELTWGLYSNSAWLTQLYRDVVPYYAYEKLTLEGRTPNMLAFFPFDNDDSFHILGQYSPWSDSIILNERFRYDPRYDDDRELLGTLIHEGIHAQGGSFLEGTSVEVESNTSAATLEIEAAMCQYGKKLACSAFWYSLHDMARNTLRSYATEFKFEGFYIFLNKLLWRDAAEWSWSDKSLRYWANHPDDLATIIYKYDRLPFETMVLPNLCYVAGLNTGFDFEDSSLGTYRLYMPFDDSQLMLGMYRPLVCWGFRLETSQAIDTDSGVNPSR